MLIRIFEDVDFKVCRKNKDGGYHNIKWHKMKYGYAVSLYNYDPVENRNHRRYIYLHSIIREYIFHLSGKLVLFVLLFELVY